MRSAFDRRVLSDPVLAVVRAFQRHAPCHLGGGAALSGAHLAHRLSRDIDLFFHQADDHRALVRALPEIARECGVQIELTRDAGSFVRGVLKLPGGEHLEVDLVHEPAPDLDAPAPVLEGIAIEPWVDLRASKLTCILSRSEPRDLVDLLFLERAGFPPDRDLPLALRKDAGIDPGILAWLLGQFPVQPLPLMLQPLTTSELEQFRDALRERFRRLSVPDEPAVSPDDLQPTTRK